MPEGVRVEQSRAIPVTPALPAFSWFWRGYARQVLEEFSQLLVG